MKENLHVVMVPWSAFGHLLPFFHLSIALAKSQIHVSFISTPKNILRLPKIPPNLSSFINLISFPLPKLDHNLLPEGAESTSDLPTEKVQYLKQATDLLRHPIKKFIADNSPDWIIVDFNANWVSEISQVPIIMFWILSAVSLLYLYPSIINQPSPESMVSPPEWVDFSTTVTYSSYEAKFMFSHLYEKRASGVGDSERFCKVIKSSKAVAYRSCEEIEDEYLSLCKKVIPSPGISIGLLPPEKPHMKTNLDLPIFKWLDKQNVKSVVFVAFGSELNLTRDQIHEIANGLEISKVHFLWILRKPNWENDDSNNLPSGFCERTSERGFVSFEWAPQLEILAHPAIGGCLVHGGWGSIIESLQFGHCLIILPFVIDQPLNAKLLVEKGLALEIRRNEIDGSFCGEDIAGKLREAMLSDGGEQMRRRVGEAAAIVGDKKLQEDYYVGAFIRFLREKCSLV